MRMMGFAMIDIIGVLFSQGGGVDMVTAVISGMMK
jgi:hypothetical protein